jgi:hypothetical protein
MPTKLPSNMRRHWVFMRKGLSLAPADTDFKEAAERVRPFAK